MQNETCNEPQEGEVWMVLTFTDKFVYSTNLRVGLAKASQRSGENYEYSTDN